jgi:4-hydroxy-3-methylbut-2-enyl diphosphate reductase IspH
MKLHVMQGHAGRYRIVCHGPITAGNNSAGFAWSAVHVRANAPVSVLTQGTGPGQTTSAEITAIAAGTTIEAEFYYDEDLGMTTAQRNAALDALATEVLANKNADIVQSLKWFGATRA